MQDEAPSQPTSPVIVSNNNNALPSPSRWRKFRQNKRLLIGVGTALIVIIVLLAIGLFGGSNELPNSGSKHANYLKPANEIKLGRARYISACQVIDEDTANAIYGPLSASSVVREKFLSKSVTSMPPSAPIQTLCQYISKDFGTYTLNFKLEQFVNAKDQNSVTAANHTSFFVDYTQLDEGIAQLKNTPGLSSNQSATRFVEELQNSAAKFASVAQLNQHPNNYLDGAVVPDPSKPAGTSFVGFYKNLAYSINYDAAANNGRPATPEQLSKMASLIGIIKKRLADSKLDQSPSPTVRENVTKVGNTSVVEPCTILDEKAFASIYGINDNAPIERVSLPADIKTVRHYQDAPHNVIPPRNVCGRTYEARNNSQTGKKVLPIFNDYGSATVRMDLEYNSNKSNADEHWKALVTPIESAGKQIQVVQTSADSAAVEVNENLGTKLAYFRVGNYTASISFTEFSQTGQYDDAIPVAADNAHFIKAINALVANLHQTAN